MKSLFLTTMITCLPLAVFAADAPAPSGPPVTITLGSRHAHVTPTVQGFTHTGGGNIDVAQPAADTLVITMTGVAVAGAHPLKNSFATLNFDLEQSLEIAFEKPEIKRAKLTVEGRVIGLLRSHCAVHRQRRTVPGHSGHQSWAGRSSRIVCAGAWSYRRREFFDQLPRRACCGDCRSGTLYASWRLGNHRFASKNSETQQSSLGRICPRSCLGSAVDQLLGTISRRGQEGLWPAAHRQGRSGKRGDRTKNQALISESYRSGHGVVSTVQKR